MARCRARRFRSSKQVLPARLPVAGDSASDVRAANEWSGKRRQTLAWKPGCRFPDRNICYAVPETRTTVPRGVKPPHLPCLAARAVEPIIERNADVRSPPDTDPGSGPWGGAVCLRARCASSHAIGHDGGRDGRCNGRDGHAGRRLHTVQEQAWRNDGLPSDLHKHARSCSAGNRPARNAHGDLRAASRTILQRRSTPTRSIPS